MYQPSGLYNVPRSNFRFTAATSTKVPTIIRAPGGPVPIQEIRADLRQPMFMACFLLRLSSSATSPARALPQREHGHHHHRSCRRRGRRRGSQRGDGPRRARRRAAGFQPTEGVAGEGKGGRRQEAEELLVVLPPARLSLVRVLIELASSGGPQPSPLTKRATRNRTLPTTATGCQSRSRSH